MRNNAFSAFDRAKRKLGLTSAFPRLPPSQKERDAEALDAAVAEGGSVPPPAADTRTAAERRFDEQAAKTQEKLIRSMASKSHRDKVKDFNEYLSKLSEHHDIPKVGPG